MRRVLLLIAHRLCLVQNCALFLSAGEVIKGTRGKYTIATKFGVTVQNEKHVINGSPQYVRDCCEASLKRLQTSYIDLYASIRS